LLALTKVDLCAIPGVNEITVLELISETGTDMSKWKTAKHFSAWLNVAPNTKKTGGKIKSTKMVKKKNRAGQSLRMSANGLSRNKSFLGQYIRRMKAKLGGKGAIVATANKLSRIIYTMLRDKKEFDPNLVYLGQEKFKLTRIKQLEKQLNKLKKEVNNMA
jgi:transposase